MPNYVAEGGPSYERGWKRCTPEDKWFKDYPGLWCPDCGTRLRTKPRYSKQAPTIVARIGKKAQKGNRKNSK